jgi:hypothetical protein
MAFKRLFPRRGTVIPGHLRPPGSKNEALHELTAYREHTHDLKGVVLYLPWTRFVVVPTRLVGGGDYGMYCMIVHGDKTYPRGGYDIDVSEWELQRAMRVVLDMRPVGTTAVGPGERPRIALAECADGTIVKVERGKPVVIEPDPGAFGSKPANPVALFDQLTPDGEAANASDTPDSRVREEDRVDCIRCGLPLKLPGSWVAKATITPEGWQCENDVACESRATKESEKTP